MTKELALELLTSANIYLTDEGRKALEKVVSEHGNSMETSVKM